jgi:hypothetical protein
MTPVVLEDGAFTPDDAPSANTPPMAKERGEAPFVSAYFDFRATPATLVIVDGASRRELDRRTLPPGTTLEAGVESAVHVLYMVCDSMLDEQATPQDANTPNGPHDANTPNRPRDANPPSRPREASNDAAPERQPPHPPVAPLVAATGTPARDGGASERQRRPRTEPGVRLDAGLLARVLHFGTGEMLPGGGAQLDASFGSGRPRFGVAWYFAASSPFELSATDASAKLYPFSTGLLPNLELRFAGDFAAIAGAGAALTWFSLSSNGPASAALGHSTGGVDVALTGALGLRAQTGPHFSLTLLGALDYDLAPRSFVSLDAGGRHVLGSLAPVRPWLSFVVAYSLVGASPETETD